LIAPRLQAFGLLLALGWPPESVWSLEIEQTIDACAAPLTEVRIGDKFGSAGMLANLRGSSDSIRAVAKELLDAALRDESQASCPASCEDSHTEVIYRVAPTMFLDTSRQRSECLRLEQRTSESPFDFAAQRFTTLDELNEWMMDFARGKGAQGRELYRLCASNCSPRYTFRIRGSHELGFTVASEVLCGLARDRSDTRYSLSSSVQLHCQNATEFRN
jgi:hypothetical protein